MVERKRSMLAATILLVMVALASWAAPVSARSAQADVPFQVVATGLNNPRGLVFTGSGKDLLVAEAGMGGAGPCFVGPEGQACLGSSGSIARVTVRDGTVERLVTGLPSLGLADPSGFNATGPHDLAAVSDTEFFVVLGLGGTPTVRERLGPGAAMLGHVVHVRTGEAPTALADLAAFEVANDVDGAGPDSNPYAIVQRSDRMFVVDAGANTLDAVDTDGTIKVATMFPSRLVPAPPFVTPSPPGGQLPMQAVPNSLDVGPDGAVYVGQLTGFPFPVGEANVYRIGANGEAELYASGFTNIIAIDFDTDGNLYVLEIAKDGLLAEGGPPTGRLVRVAKDSKEQTVLASDGLVAPGGLLVGDDAIYISNFAIFPGQGQIVRIER